MSFIDAIQNLLKPTTPAVTTMTSAPATIAPTSTFAPILKLDAALRAAAPHADLSVWVPALTTAFRRFGMDTKPKEMAAAIGQFTVESGGFKTTIENTCYTTAERLVCVFPSEFPNIDSTAGYVGNPVKIANRCYANRLGNGDEASGDGNRYKGRGLIQITGKFTYAALGDYLKMTPEQASAYCETPEGSAVSACWFLYSRGCFPLADIWGISGITLKVNGRRMLGLQERIAASNAARQAFGVGI
jgi:predicted chitinase